MKRILFILIVVALTANSYAQLTTRKSAAIQWIEETTKSAFFLSRQSFQVSDKKTGELYGLNNNNEFGTEITLGVKVRNGYLLTDKAICPWEYNAKFETYKENYTPVPYASEYSEFDSTVKYDTLDIAHPNELLTKSIYFVSSAGLSGKGLVVDCTKGKKEGWVVWIGTDKDDDLNRKANLRLTCYSEPVEASEDVSVDVEVPDNQNILGGIYVAPINTAIGVLEFRICGVIGEKDGKWSIRFPFIGKEKWLKPTPNKDKQEVKTDGGNDDLTPVDDMYPQKSSKDRKSKKKSKKRN